MNKKAVLFLLGRILLLEGAFMLPSLILAIANNSISSIWAFAITIACLAVLGGILSFFKKALKDGIHAKEGFVTVSLGWILLSLFGALPFFISGYIPSFLDAWFEAVSGITTTGASILSNVEALPNALLFWRCFLNWMGGMGVLVFMVALIPMAKGSGESLYLMRAESPGPVISKLMPKMRHTAQILYLIYIGLTVILCILLLVGGMPVFDSICHALSTAGTGGFSIKNASIGFYDSYYLQTVIGIFMMLFGVNFGVYYLLLMRDFKNALKNEEVRLYLGIIAASVLLIAINVRDYFPSLRDTVHHTFFQVSSIITTTGFSSVDFDLWPQFSKSILLILMVLGACAGSTGGGFKISRLLILVKSARHELQRILHPRSVKVIKLDGRVLDDSIIKGVYGYFVLYCLILAISMLLISLSGFGLTTSLTAVIACVNNIGPGFDIVGPAGNYAAFSGLSKVILSFDMLIGRLEIYPMLLLFSPTVWGRGK